MTNQHPITPPLELVRQWSLESQDEHQPPAAYSMVGLLTTKAARWGADQELKACCEWLIERGGNITFLELRAARRPKPPSLKKQAITALHAVATGANDTREQQQDLDTIRKALEELT